MTADQWNNTQVEVLARARELSPTMEFDPAIQGWIDDRIVGLFNEGLRDFCPTIVGVQRCGAPLHTESYSHDPGGPHEFIAVRKCQRGHRVTEELVDQHQAAVDATVRRTLTLELPLKHCPIRTCIDECGGDLLAHGYVASLQGTPGFWVYLTCSRGHAPYWGRLFGEAKGAAA